MGHCGRKYSDQLDFRNYIGPKLFGQAAYLIHHEGETLTTLGGPNGNPFYLIMADWFQPISYNCNSSRYSLGTYWLIYINKRSHAIKFLAKK
jgi:hypothetical protein